MDSTVISGKIVGLCYGKIEETAQQTQFVRRESSMMGLNFLEATILGFLEKADVSLNELAQSFLDLGVVVAP